MAKRADGLNDIFEHNVTVRENLYAKKFHGTFSGIYEIPGETPGSVIFVDSNKYLAGDNSNLFWDDTNKRLGIGTASPLAKLDVEGSVIVGSHGGSDKLYLNEYGSDISYVVAGSEDKNKVQNIWFQARDSSGNIFNALKIQGNKDIIMDSGGDVGIGTNSPSEKLELDGNIKIQDDHSIKFRDDDLKIYSSADGILNVVTNDYVTIGTGTKSENLGPNSLLVSDRLEVEDYAFFRTGIVNRGSLTIYDGTKQGARWSVNYPNRHLSLAVGTNAGRNVIYCPSIYADRNFDHGTSAGVTSFYQSSIDPDLSNNEWGSTSYIGGGFIFETGANTGTGSSPTTVDNFISFKPRGVDAVRIAGNGNVGIGTTSPGSLLELSGDTGLTLSGNSRVEKVIWIGANGIKAPGAKPATFVEDGLTGCWEFGDEIEANQESISGTVKIPNDMDRSVAPKFGIGWHANGVSPGDCKWQFEYLWRSPNEDATAGAQETLTVTSTASATSNGLIVAEITGIDLPSGTDVAMFWRVTRLSGDGDDTIADVTHLRGNYFKYTSNKLGEAI